MGAPVDNREFSQRVVPNLLIIAAVLAGLWGLMMVVGFVGEMSAVNKWAHFPFWLTIGTIGLLLNYLPLAKSKPGLIPKLGMFAVLGTTLWFCFNNFFELKDIYAFAERVRVDAILLILCYSLTHSSLLLLAYRPNQKNYLLTAAITAVGISGLAYLTVLSGLGDESIGVSAALIAMAFFFIKFTLTVVVVIQHLSGPKEKAPPKMQTLPETPDIIYED